MKKRNYGFPYMGSKNSLAERIVDFLPEAENLVEPFCGGCAITHRALLINKYQNYYINDIDPLAPNFFVNCLKGKYKNDTRWISRKDFELLKNTDPFVKFCWSFGNNGKGYLYSPEREEYKKAAHYAICFNDYSLLEALGIFIEHSSETDLHNRRLDVCRKLTKVRKEIRKLLVDMEAQSIENLKRAERLNQMFDNHKENNKIEEVLDLERLERISNLFSNHKENNHIEGIENLEMFERTSNLFGNNKSSEIVENRNRVENLQRISNLFSNNKSSEIVANRNSVESVESLERLDNDNIDNIHISSMSFEKMVIPPNSVIYCDIPYKGTAKYSKQDFDYDEFYEWAHNQTNPVFISSYEMPEGFKEVAAFDHRCTLSSIKNNEVIEKLFIPV